MGMLQNRELPHGFITKSRCPLREGRWFKAYERLRVTLSMLRHYFALEHVNPYFLPASSGGAPPVVGNPMKILK